MPALQKTCRVLRSDTRGHGLSAVFPGPYTIEQLARDVLAVLDELKINQVHFCGLSMGGLIGLWLGIYAPERVTRLVLCNSGAKIGAAEMWNARIAKVRAGGMAAIADSTIERWFSRDFIATCPQEIASVRKVLLETPPEGYSYCCEAVRDADLRQTASRVSAPTLVIAGTHDVATPPADGQFVAARIRGARYVEFNASHLSNIEAAGPFTSELVGFLTTS